MTRKQIVLVAALILIISSLSALLAYRHGQRRARAAPGAGSGDSAGCVDFHDVAPHVGDYGCVTGRVLRVYTSRAGNTFLDFCTDYRHCPFTSVVFASDRDKFGNLQTLVGREVEIRGAITLYQEHAEIVISESDQIRTRD